jgi:hypothetical protein
VKLVRLSEEQVGAVRAIIEARRFTLKTCGMFDAEVDAFINPLVRALDEAEEWQRFMGVDYGDPKKEPVSVWSLLKVEPADFQRQLSEPNPLEAELKKYRYATEVGTSGGPELTDEAYALIAKSLKEPNPLLQLIQERGLKWEEGEAKFYDVDVSDLVKSGESDAGEKTDRTDRTDTPEVGPVGPEYETGRTDIPEEPQAPKLVLGKGNPGYEEQVHVDPVPAAPAVPDTGRKPVPPGEETFEFPLSVALDLVKMRLEDKSAKECSKQYTTYSERAIGALFQVNARQIGEAVSAKTAISKNELRNKLLTNVRLSAVDHVVTVRRRVKL